ncbi:MAG: HAMP domain-containing histidine kinase, partial [Gemmataceae bacterium]|nr:HAMP domain-containing histidine kinase [Gemmataceae bacterium]
QYLLRQLAAAEEQLVEDPSPAFYLDSLKAKMHKSLTTIIGQAQRIHHVLTDLMQFARPSKPRRQPIALPTLLLEAVAAVQAAACDKKVEIQQVDVPGDLIIAGDAAQWRTVLINVVRNGVEAAPSGGWVRFACRTCGREAVEVSIEDNGPGPSPSAQEHLFDPFFSGRTAGRGRGLGLSTAWRLARQNGGDVQFAGAAHGVTRFVVRLPIDVQAASRAA